MPRRWLDPAFFGDEKMKKCSVEERLLALAMIANQDDDGRLRGDPAYLRAIAFLYDDYSLDQVKAVRDHIAEVNPNFTVYQNAGEDYIQLKHHTRYQKPRYYHPSKFPPPPGWPFEDKNPIPKLPSSNQKVTLGKDIDIDLDLDLDKDRVRDGQLQTTLLSGNQEVTSKQPSSNHEVTTPSPSTKDILDRLKKCYPYAFGKEPGARISAQLRDLATELSAAGCPLPHIDEAFREAASVNKLSVSYIKAILFNWLGVAKKD